MDTFFISHGAPTMVVDESIPARSFLQSWKSSVMHETPKAILMVSAHWDTDAPTVNLVHGANDTFHDFYGFPSKMYKVISQIIFSQKQKSLFLPSFLIT
jgi:4,5-DOPA dioxygenase extradiol